VADNDERSALLSARTALIFLCAVIAEASAGILTSLARHSPIRGRRGRSGHDGGGHPVLSLADRMTEPVTQRNLVPTEVSLRAPR
jgi:hypothetical protein